MAKKDDKLQANNGWPVFGPGHHNTGPAGPMGDHRPHDMLRAKYSSTRPDPGKMGGKEQAGVRPRNPVGKP